MVRARHDAVAGLALVVALLLGGAEPVGSVAEPPLETTVESYTFVDTSRATPCSAAAERTLKVTVALPSAGETFPVIVVGPGSGASQRAVARADAQELAGRGYLAVAMEFPCTNAPGLTTLDPLVALDIYRQPADVSFVLTRLLEKGETPGDELEARLDPERIGYIGTSSGAVTGLLFFNNCCADARVRAVVAVKGFAVPTGAGLPVEGDYDWSRAISLLMWSACNDVVTPFALARDTYTQAAPPKFFVQDPTGDHSTPVTFPPGTFDAFLDRYIAGDTAPEQLATLVAAAGPTFAYDLGGSGTGGAFVACAGALVSEPVTAPPSFTG